MGTYISPTTPGMLLCFKKEIVLNYGTKTLLHAKLSLVLLTMYKSSFTDNNLKLQTISKLLKVDSMEIPTKGA